MDLLTQGLLGATVAASTATAETSGAPEATQTPETEPAAPDGEATPAMEDGDEPPPFAFA